MVFTHFKDNGMNKSDPGLNIKDTNSQINNDEDIVFLLFEGITSLERGIQGLNKNVVTTEGKIDIIAVDMIGRIVLIEVGTQDTEDLLFKSIDHFDWALTNMKNLKEKYKFFNVDSTLAPRIIILAPSYSERFIKRASYLNPTFIDIYEYQIKESLGVKKVYFRPFSFLNHKKWVVYLRTKSLDDHLNYMEDEILREVLKNFLVEMQSLRNDYTLDTSRGYVRFKDRKEDSILSICVLKKSFWVNLGNKKWDGHLVRTKEALNSLKPFILQNIRKEV